MQLVIAEKPSVARDLARVLGVPARGGSTSFVGRDYAITWCIGHLVELVEPAEYDAAWKAWRLDRLPMLPPEFKVQPSKHARAQLKAVSAERWSRPKVGGRPFLAREIAESTPRRSSASKP